MLSAAWFHEIIEAWLYKLHKSFIEREGMLLPVKLSEQMDIWLQLQSSPGPNSQYPVNINRLIKFVIFSYYKLSKKEAFKTTTKVAPDTFMLICFLYFPPCENPTKP